MAKPKSGPIDKRIGARIKGLRKLCDLTQAELASLITNIDEQASATVISVNAWENGRSRISDRNLSALSRVIWDELKKTQAYQPKGGGSPERVHLPNSEYFTGMDGIFYSSDDISTYIKTGKTSAEDIIHNLLATTDEKISKYVVTILGIASDQFLVVDRTVDEDGCYCDDRTFQWACNQITCDDYYELFIDLTHGIRNTVIQYAEKQEILKEYSKHGGDNKAIRERTKKKRGVKDEHKTNE